MNTNETINTNTTKNTNNMEVNTMNIKELLQKGTINTIEEYEFFKNNADTIEGDYYNTSVEIYITDIRIYFNGGFAEIYEVEDGEDVTQNIRFYNDTNGQVDTYEKAYELTESEILEQYKDEILNELEDICRKIYQAGNDLTYTLYYDRRNENFYTMEHTGNSYSGDRSDVALASYSQQYEDAASDLSICDFFDFLKDGYDIHIEELDEPSWNDDEELIKEYDEYIKRVDELKDRYWDSYIDCLVEGFAWEWAKAEFDNLEMRWK